MSLLRWKGNSWNNLPALQDEVERFFDFFYPREISGLDAVLVPKVDVSEDKDNIYVEADVPGFDQKDIKVSLKDGALSLSAKKESAKEEKKKNYHRIERAYGSFYRQIPLPGQIDESKVKAVYKNGVLNLTLPKREEEKAKEIKIDVE